MLVLDPLGCPYLGHSDDFAINFEEIPSSFVLNVFLWLLCINKWTKLGSHLHNTNILGVIFVQNFGI
jgi:hypothetical protein